jgi:hypothetical protein
MRLARLILTSTLSLVLTGCASEPRGAREVIVRELQKPQPATNPFLSAIQPMFGYWVPDIEASLRENAHVSEEMRAMMRADLEINSFELLINERAYVSVSATKTNADRYTVTNVDGDAVFIVLRSMDRLDPPRERRTRLRLRENRLLIDTATPFTVVMQRPTTGPSN